MRRASLLPILLFALLGGCGRGSPAAAAPEPAWTPLPAAARVYYDNSGGIQDSMRVVVRDEATLRTLWDQATSQQTMPPAFPAVDFRQEMVLVVGAGRMTPEDQISVDSIGIRRRPDAGGRSEQVFTAFVRTTEGCRRFNADAYPLEIVRVRRFDGTVQFVESRERATDCR